MYLVKKLVAHLTNVSVLIRSPNIGPGFQLTEYGAGAGAGSGWRHPSMCQISHYAQFIQTPSGPQLSQCLHTQPLVTSVTVLARAANEPSPTSVFTFKTVLRHHAKGTLTHLIIIASVSAGLL